jgi:NAD dependent epimerase/dehydratase family enzyme
LFFINDKFTVRILAHRQTIRREDCTQSFSPKMNNHLRKKALRAMEQTRRMLMFSTLLIVAADVGARAVLRRLSRGGLGARVGLGPGMIAHLSEALP